MVRAMRTHSTRDRDFIARFLAPLRPELAGSFTDAQLDAIRFAFGMRYRGSHGLSIRKRIGRWYVVLLAGNDGR